MSVFGRLFLGEGRSPLGVEAITRERDLKKERKVKKIVANGRLFLLNQPSGTCVRGAVMEPIKIILLATLAFAFLPGSLLTSNDTVLVQNGQWSGQYSRQYSGQWSGQYSGQYSGRYSGQYTGQSASPTSNGTAPSSPVDEVPPINTGSCGELFVPPPGSGPGLVDNQGRSC